MCGNARIGYLVPCVLDIQPDGEEVDQLQQGHEAQARQQGQQTTETKLKILSKIKSRYYVLHMYEAF